MNYLAHCLNLIGGVGVSLQGETHPGSTRIKAVAVGLPAIF